MANVYSNTDTAQFFFIYSVTGVKQNQCNDRNKLFVFSKVTYINIIVLSGRCNINM